MLNLQVSDRLAQLGLQDRVELKLKGSQQLVNRQLSRLKIAVVPQPVGNGVRKLSILASRIKDNRRLAQLLELPQQRQGGGRLATTRLPHDQQMVVKQVRRQTVNCSSVRDRQKVKCFLHGDFLLFPVLSAESAKFTSN